MKLVLISGWIVLLCQLNSSITSSGSAPFENLNFKCASLEYDSIYVTTDDGSVSDVSYGNVSPYRYLSAYNGDSGWLNESYRTITFATAPTGDLLTWLQANGTKQGGVTEHTLTCTDDAIIISVNGSVVTSPYTLQNGDTIVLKRASSPWYSAIIIAGENTYDTDAMNLPIDIANSDIFVARGDSDNSPSLYAGFTINYTA